MADPTHGTFPHLTREPAGSPGARRTGPTGPQAGRSIDLTGSRAACLRDLRQGRVFDLLVIGGGSIGTAVARDAALRGISTALIEREDFGAGTVARSTRLIHGGLRYLELRDFRLVREALRERETLLRTAPHLVRALSFLTPIYRGDRWSPWMVGVGMLLYDLLSYDKSLPRHRIMSAEEAVRLEPGLRREGLLGAALYYDAQVASPERWCIAQARSAAESGARCANHLGADGFIEEKGRVFGIHGEERLTGAPYAVRARVTVNATGPWAGDLVPAPDGSPRLRRTQGVHLIVPRLTDHAVVLLAQRDGRVFFVIPWRGRTMVGTTDTEFSGDPSSAVASRDDVRYLVEETRRVFPRADLSHVDLEFAGVRPLLPSGAAHESQASREHRIVDHAGEGKAGLLSVLGGKLTTARAIAEDVVDRAAAELGMAAPCRTAETPIWGGDLPAPLPAFMRALEGECRSLGLPAGTEDEWIAAYGSHAADLLGVYRQRDVVSSLDLEFSEAGLGARLLYGVREEAALTTADLLLRRTLAGYREDQSRAIAPGVARWLGEQLDRAPDAVARDLADYEDQAGLLKSVA